MKRSEKKVTRRGDDQVKKLSATAPLSPSAYEPGQNEEMIYELVDKLIGKIHMLNKLLRAKTNDGYNQQCPVSGYENNPYSNQRVDTFQSRPPEQLHMNAPYPSHPNPPSFYQPEYANGYQVNSPMYTNAFNPFN